MLRWEGCWGDTKQTNHMQIKAGENIDKTQSNNKLSSLTRNNI